MNHGKNESVSSPGYQQVITSPGKSPSGKGHSRYSGKIKALDGLWLELKNAALDTSPITESSSKSASSSGGMVSCLPILRDVAPTNPIIPKGNGFRIDCTQLGPIHRKSHARIISIKNLFSNTPKFVKNFQRGVYLSSLIYSEDKILVTMDDILPTFQIDEDLSSSFQHDFHWLHKISSIWADAKFLKQEIEKCDSASTFHFRVKLLQTVVTMQDSLDLRDLGKVFYKPITTENNNVTFICTINHLRSVKLVSVPNLKWIPIEKFKAKKPASDTYHVLSQSSQNLMLYHQVANLPLGKGLYLTYFKLVNSVDQLKLIVTENRPNILPHVKIRGNPTLTKSEWELFTNCSKFQDSSFINNNQVLDNKSSLEPPTILTESQQTFKNQLDSGLKKLFSHLRIDRSSALNHRFYTTEVIEVSSSVALIVILPPTEVACCIEGDDKDLKWIQDHKLITLPVQVFEITHMLTYHNTLARRLMRLSSTLEVETVLAQHNRRKAFSTEEMTTAQSQLCTLTNLHTKLETTWKECRWMLEVVKAARAKDRNFVSLRDFLNRYPPSNPSASKGTSPTHKNSKNSKTTPSSSPKKLPKGTYINAGQPFTRAQLQQLLNLRKVEESSPELPPNLPSNPNFKFESCSSLPIVGKAFSTTNFDKMRTSASLFELQLGPPHTRPRNPGSCDSTPNSTSTSSLLLQRHCSEAFMKLGLHLQTEDEPELHYQNVQEVEKTSPEHDYQNLANFHATYRPPLPRPPDTAVTQELDAYLTQQTSSQVRTSKLVSLATMTNRLRTDSNNGHAPNGHLSNGHISNGNSHYRGGEAVPGTSDPAGLRTLSWTKQRTSLDRCFNLELPVPKTLSCSSTCSEGSRSSRERLLEEDEGGNETDCSRVSGPLFARTASKVLEIYAAYTTGNAGTGTCVRLQVTWDTQVRQIIRSLIDKLSGDGVGSNVDDFCLVAVLGARERVLRMDYKPLRLQNPWKEGTLYVRRKVDITAAVSLEASLKSQKS